MMELLTDMMRKSVVALLASSDFGTIITRKRVRLEPAQPAPITELPADLIRGLVDMLIDSGDLAAVGAFVSTCTRLSKFMRTEEMLGRVMFTDVGKLLNDNRIIARMLPNGMIHGHLRLHSYDSYAMHILFAQYDRGALLAWRIIVRPTNMNKEVYPRTFRGWAQSHIVVITNCKGLVDDQIIIATYSHGSYVLQMANSNVITVPRSNRPLPQKWMVDNEINVRVLEDWFDEWMISEGLGLERDISAECVSRWGSALLPTRPWKKLIGEITPELMWLVE